MFEFIKTSVSLLNLPFTIFLILVLLYWIVVIIGAADLELFEAEWMPDLEIDDGGGIMDSLLQLLGVGEIPAMIIISLLALSGWCFSMVANYLFNSSQSLLIGAGLLIPNLIVTFFITSVFVRLIHKIIGPPAQDKEDQKIMYKVGVVTTSEITPSFGQVEIQTKGAPITINARTSGDSTLKKGDKALVFDEDKEKGIFFVEKFNE